MKTTFTCHICKETKTVESTFTSGYGIDKDNNKVCYECCAYEDKADMLIHGNATLYFSHTDGKGDYDYEITNWPGSLRFPVSYVKIGKHNIAGKRYDAWFKFNGKTWHSVTYGDNTQIAHCKVTK